MPLALTALAAAIAAAKSNLLSAIGSALALGFQIRPFVNPDGSVDGSKVAVRVPNSHGEAGVKRLNNWRRGCHLSPLGDNPMVHEPTVGKTYTWFFFPLAHLTESKMHSGMSDWYAGEIGVSLSDLLNPEPSPVAKLEAAWRTASENPTNENLAAMRDMAMEYISHNLNDSAKPFLLRVVYLLGQDK